MDPLALFAVRRLELDALPTILLVQLSINNIKSVLFTRRLKQHFIIITDSLQWIKQLTIRMII